MPEDHPAPDSTLQSDPNLLSPASTAGEGGTERLGPPTRTPPEPRLPRTEKTPEPARSPQPTAAETLCPPLPDGRLPDLPGYQLLGLLGSGSYGQVYKALELSSGKTVAIKFFLRGTDEKWHALIEEVRQHARMDAVPGIVDLKAAVPDHDPPYYVMAFADHGSLGDRLASREPLPFREAMRLFRQIAQALAYVHAKGICHCDLKPGNVLLDARNHALLADFGQAQPASKGHPALGTLYFMPPEQADPRSQLPDPTWDVYALGAILYTSLTGKLPRQDEAEHRKLQQITDIPARLARYRAWLAIAPPPLAHRSVPGVDSLLMRIIERCLDLDPHRRFRDASEVLAALETRGRMRRQRPVIIFGLAASLLLLLITALNGTRSKNEAMAGYQRDLTSQLVDSNRSSASLIASTVARQLGARLDRVVNAATTEPTRSALVKGLRTGNREKLEEVLQTLMRNNDGRPQPRFAETTVTNRRGQLAALIQLTRKEEPGTGRVAYGLTPISPEVLRPVYPHFSWRDWFSGQGDQYDATSKQHPPIRHPHVSDPYASSLEAKSLFISMSAPIIDPANRDDGVIGVVEAAIAMTEMGRWLREANIARGGEVVMLGKRRHCVFHPRNEHLPRLGEAARPLFTAAEADRLFPDPMGTLEDYKDPITGRTSLVGYARTSDPRLDWIVLVQHDREKVLAPIETLSGRLSLIGWQSFLAAIVLVGGMWGWLYWTIRQMELPGSE